MDGQVDGTGAHVQTCALCGEKFDGVASLDAHLSPQGRCRDPWTMSAAPGEGYLFRLNYPGGTNRPAVWSLNPIAEAAS